jgi:ABC-2 type transport system permease protein
VASALNSLAATSFTREGQHLELIKFIPVPFKTQMYAKAMVSFIFTYPALLVTDIIVCAYIDAGIVRCLVIAVFMLLAHVIALVAGMILDSSSPYVEWSDEYSALRGNLNAFFNMAVMMFVSLLVIALGLLLYEVLKLPVKAYYIVMFLTLLAAAIRFVMVGPKVIIKNMSKLF